ncbi:LysM peptidoglycan-binding domain-containing protein [Aquimarina aquimarini]|uniref:LysM peptidoglycan-binding domain-containing protein n=1 Tax=Aquimarina aquimarini TaxID=1191734 RepID=UPI000D560411|nr:LysM peptidoglycan-binding domain-containing protein [Aquimarina aquimarini]
MGDFNDLLNKLMQGQEASESATSTSIQDMLALIQSKDELRFYVDNTPNFGHQATTINMMKRIVDATTYSKKILIIYSGSDTPNKLAILLTGLNPNDIATTSITYGKATLTFLEYKDTKPDLEQIDFGFTGGADNSVANYATLFSVNYFLRLQPYLWEKAPNQIERNGKEPYDLSKESASFAQLAFKFSADSLSSVSDTLWSWYAKDQTYNEALKIRSINAQSIYNVYTAKKELCLWPIYGLHQFSSPAEMTLNLILSAFTAQKSMQKPIAFFILSDIAKIEEKYQEMPFDYVAAFAKDLDNKDTSLPHLKATIKEVYLATDIMGAYSQSSLDNFILNLGQQVKPLMDAGYTLTIREGYKNGNYVEIKDLTTILEEANNKEIVAITLGPIPQEIYNFYYANSGLPGVFEGQGSSSLPISLGHPFLQIPKTGEEDRANYPSTLSAVNYAPVAETAKTTALTFRNQTFDTYLQKINPGKPQEYYNALVDSGSFMINAYTASNNINTYFKSLGTYYQQDIHDKLMLGLVGVKLVSPAVTLLKFSESHAHASSNNGLMVLEEETLTLEGVYNQLINNYSNDGVNILNALPNTYLSSFFKLVTGNLFFITVAKDDITQEKDGDTVTQVTLSKGTTTAFGPDFNITLNFTSPEESVVTEIETEINQRWSIDEIPWIGFEKPGFKLKINEAGSAVEGGMKGTIVGSGTDKNNDPVLLETLIKYPEENNTWLITGGFDTPLSVSSFFQMAGGINLVQVLQPPLNGMAGFGLKDIQLHYNNQTHAFDYMSYSMNTDTAWELSKDPKFEINPSVDVQIYNVQDVANRKIEFTVTGDFPIGEGTVSVLGTYPDFKVHGGLSEGVIQLSDLLKLFGAKLDLETAVTLLDFDLKPNEKYYQLNTILEADKPLVIGPLFTINKLTFNAIHNTGKNEISIGGEFVVLPDSMKIGLSLQSTYATGNGWTFTGNQTSGALEIGQLLTFYIAPDWKPDDGFNYAIDGLGFKIQTETKYWEFSGKTAEKWDITFLDLQVDGNALVAYGKKDEETSVGYYGTINANVTWLGIDFQAFYDFNPDVKSFGIIWEFLKGEVKNIGTSKEPHYTAELSFTESTTIGSMVEKMVSWATGTQFGLAAPWDLLNKIPLNNLSLTYDFTSKQVGFNLEIGPISLGFATIKSIGITYKSNQPKPEDNGVMVTLEGSFLWQDNPNEPLGWDAAKPETTPSPSGQGNEYLDLRLLALGQHVTIPGFQNVEKVQDAIAIMADLPNTKPGEIPDVQLDANSNWLVGMDFGVLKLGGDKKSTSAVAVAKESDTDSYFITMQIVFNDPNLYALRLALEGEPARIFKGLDFQILYKKISDTVGMYKAEIALPTVMRKIQLGQVNLTLPIFGIEVYTNGDFQVDIGFPWKEDFSRSFTFQTLIWTPVGIPIPVMGSAGVYFGKLSSATTNKVPDATNGTFNPVLVFGFGMQFGFGYDFDAGILKAGFSLTAVAILEGVLAKFNPYQLSTTSASNDAQVAEAYYFWFRGTVGVIGKLYGTVDFAIIKADLNIDIRLLAQLTFSPYEPIVIQLSASVSVSLSVSINLGLFKIKMHFSFSASISQSITIKAIASNPPWQTATSDTMLKAYTLNRLQNTKQLRIALHNPLTVSLTQVTPNWSNLEKASELVSLTGYLGLGLTMAGDRATQLSEQQACYVSMLFLESMASPQEERTDGYQKAFSEITDSSFELLSKEIFRWVVASIQSNTVTGEQVNNTPITSSQLTQLLAYFSDPTNPSPIPTEAIDSFMTDQFSLVIQEQPQEKTDVNATFFPMALSLELSTPDYGSDYKGVSYDFENYNSISSTYVADLRKYFNQLAIQMQEENPATFATLAEEDISVGNFVFSDYFLLIAKQMVQTAQDSLKDFKYYTNSGDTPDNIVKWINDNGDLSGDMAYTIDELFSDNSGITLNVKKTIYIPNSTYTVQQGDTFDSIANQPMYATSFDGNSLALLNKDAQNILQGGIAIRFTYNDYQYDYTTLSSQSLTEVVNAINAGVPNENKIDINILITDGSITTIPNLLLTVATIRIDLITYTTIEEDTLRTIASKFNVTQQDLATPIDQDHNNGAIIDLFDTTTLDMANLEQFKVGELLKEIQATQGIQHLSGMTSRYYLAGLKLPVDGITPNFQGMWVEDDNDVLSYRELEFAGLYALNGQQFPIPTLTEGNDFDITFSKPDTLQWLAFSGDNASKRVITIVPDSDDATRINKVSEYATTNKLNTGLSFLGVKDLFTNNEASYPYTSEIVWNAAATIDLPYGGTPPGVPALSLWPLPDTLLQLPDLSTRKVNPRMEFLIGEYDEVSKKMINHGVSYYGLGSLVEVTIKKVPVVSDSPATLTTYEVVGANSNNAAILEKIVSEIGANNSLIASLIPAYAVDSNGSTQDGVQTDTQNALTMGLAQVNLSTETRPDVTFDRLLKTLSDTESEKIRLLNTQTDFLRLLWQASITRNGGYYLYYYNADNQQGLPDRIFDDNGEAELSFIVMYDKPAEENLQNTITSYMNVFACGEAFNKDTSVLFAQSDPNIIKLPSDTTQTLQELAYTYYGNIADVASDNQSLLLSPNTKLAINEGIYEVGVGGNTLQEIADRFDTTVIAIQEINNQKSGNELPDQLNMFDAIFLPQLTIIVGTSPGGNTFATLSDFYGENISSIANYNQNVVGIFDDNQEILSTGGPKIRTANVAVGTTSIDAIRPIPAAVPEDPKATDFGELFLQNIYSSLTYQVVANDYFDSSNIGLPSGPTTEAEDPDSTNKIQVPKTLTAEDTWNYQVSIPYTRFSKEVVSTKDIMPDSNDSPYLGLGDLLQVNFAWQDIYGNSIISELSDPSANSIEPLNEPPVLTGYTDAILGLNQWPSITSSWIVSGEEAEAKLDMGLNFDPSYYQGLISTSVKSTTTILGQYTVDLDKTTATDISNYTIDQNINIQSIILNDDNKSVTITVDTIPENVEITVTISNVKADASDSDNENTLVFNGWSKFSADNDKDLATSSVKEQAIRDLQTYTQIWYQLTDPNGIAFQLNTTLTDTPFVLDENDIEGLVQEWIASIYVFLVGCGQGEIDTDIPDSDHILSFDIDTTQINTTQIFKLESSFTIERTGGSISGDFETTGGIKAVHTNIPPLSKAKSGTTTGLEEFATSFETALSKKDSYQLRVTSGINRNENLSNSGGTEIWATRLGLDTTTDIGYEVNNIGNPEIFAPKPISNQLETKEQVPIYYFNSKTGIDFSTPSTYMDFKNIDMDLWGKQIFSAIDAVLTPEFTAAIQLVDDYGKSNFLADMLTNKERLAEVLKLSMIPVFAGQTTDTVAIQETFLQQLLVKLSNAYTTRAGIQFEATVQAETVLENTDAPQLYGNINLNFIFIGVEIDEKDATIVYLFFSNFMNKATAEKISNYTISDDINVVSATLLKNNNRIVSLRLSAKASIDKTTVTITDTLQDELGNTITSPLIHAVQQEVDGGNFSTSFSMSSPKLELNKNTKAKLPFLISSPDIIRGTDNEVLSYVDLNITYSGFAIEHQISSVNGIEGYKASSWLSFISKTLANPLETSLGGFKIPLILRSFPTAPAMIKQEGSYPYISGTNEINDILKWNYQITYSQSFHYPQDQVDFEILFNVLDNSAKALASFEDAFAQMAEFITVFPNINQVFNDTLIKIDATTTDASQFESAAVALSSYNEMVSQMAKTAESSNGFALNTSHRQQKQGYAAVPYTFYIKEGSTTVDTTTGALIINIFGEAPEGIETPIVNISGYKAVAIDPEDGASYSYYYTDNNTKEILEASVGQAIPDREVLIPAMNILNRQDADTSAELKRNVELVPGKPSANDFVYTTGSIGFSNVFHPTIDSSDSINIATINNPSSPNIGTLEQQLTTLFDTLLAENSQETISVLMSSTYSYQANSGLSDIVLPVIMQPLQSIQVIGSGTDKTLNQMIEDWANSIKDWYSKNQIDNTKASLWFDLTVFSNLTEQPKPLIRLRALTLSLDYITNL